ncbi:hypothetical protein STEG23_018795, partial [Scotinomys teguina]
MKRRCRSYQDSQIWPITMCSQLLSQYHLFAKSSSPTSIFKPYSIERHSRSGEVDSVFKGSIAVRKTSGFRNQQPEDCGVQSQFFIDMSLDPNFGVHDLQSRWGAQIREQIQRLAANNEVNWQLGAVLILALYADVFW